MQFACDLILTIRCSWLNPDDASNKSMNHERIKDRTENLEFLMAFFACFSRIRFNESWINPEILVETLVTLWLISSVITLNPLPIIRWRLNNSVRLNYLFVVRETRSYSLFWFPNGINYNSKLNIHCRL